MTSILPPLLYIDSTMFKRVIALAIPMIISGMMIPLQIMVDYAIVGRMGHDYLVASLGLAGFCMAFIFLAVGAIRMASVGLCAQSFGANDHQQLALHVGRAILLGIIISIILVALSPLLLNLARLAYNSTERVEDAMIAYMAVRFYALPLQGLLMAILGFLLGIGKARNVMIISLITSVTNMGFSAYFVFMLHYGFVAVAWGTNIGELLGLCYALYCFRHAILHHDLHFNIKKIMRYKPLWSMFTLNNDIMLRTMVLMGCFYGITFISAHLGELALAVNNLIFTVVLIGSFILDGFASATQTLVGQAYGKKNYTELYFTIYQSLKISFIAAIIIACVLLLTRDYWLLALTNSPNLLKAASIYSFWPPLTMVIGVTCYIFDGVFIGLSKGKILRNATIITAICWGCIATLTYQWGNNHILWATINCLYLIRAIPLLVYFTNMRRIL